MFSNAFVVVCYQYVLKYTALIGGGGLCLIGLHGGDNYPLQSGLFRINRRNSTAVYRVSKHFKLLLTYFDFFSFILVIIHFMTWQKFMTFSLADDLWQDPVAILGGGHFLIMLTFLYLPHLCLNSCTRFSACKNLDDRRCCYLIELFLGRIFVMVYNSFLLLDVVAFFLVHM